MRLNRHLLLGVLNSGWTAVLGVITIPIYLKTLGVESYGLISFYAMLQGLFLLLEVGLSPAVSREISRNKASKNSQNSQALIITLAKLYYFLALFIAILIFFGSSQISSHWIKLSQLNESTVTQTIIIMGLAIACRWPIGLYQAVIIGSQQLAVSSKINILMTSISSFGAIAIVTYISKDLRLLFAWLAIIGLTHTLIIRSAAWRILTPPPSSFLFNLKNIKPILGFTAGMGALSITSAILLQMDRVVLSRMLPLEEFATYTLAYTLANGLYIILGPVFNIIYPKISELVIKQDTQELISYYRKGTRLLTYSIFPIAAVVFTYSNDILNIWTNNYELANSAAPITSLLVLGFAINGAMIFPYALQLAHGDLKVPIKITIVLIVVQLPILIVLLKTYGTLGGGISWLMLNVLNLFYGTWVTHKLYLKSIGLKWFLCDVALPLTLVLILTYYFQLYFYT